MTWEIAVGIFSLVSIFAAVGKIVSNNTKAMTEMKVSLDDLKEALKENKEDVKQLKNDVSDHETRIIVLETKKGE